MINTATVPTEHAKRYLGQFAKHFAHKLPVDLAETNEAGQVDFPFGECRMAADSEALHFSIEAATSDELTRLQDVVARHLVRFAFREEIALSWQTPS